MDWEWYTDSNCVHLFTHLLLKCNHKKASWRGETIERGETITSLGMLANEVGMSIQTLRTTLKKLESTSEITKKSTSKLTRISVCNYNSYQDGDEFANTPTNTVLTNDQHSANKQLTTNNNDNNDNNDNNENNPKRETRTHEVLKSEISDYEKIASECVGFWNEKLGSKARMNHTVTGLIKSHLAEYGVEEVKNTFAKAITIAIDDKYYPSSLPTLMRFLNGSSELSFVSIAEKQLEDYLKFTTQAKDEAF